MRDMAVDPEVKEILDEHSERIHNIEKNYAVVDERLKSIEQGQQEVKNTVLSSNNAILSSMNTMTQTMSQIVINQNDNKTQLEIAKHNNHSEAEIAKHNNKSALIKQIILLGGTFFGGLKLPDIVDWLGRIFD